MLKIAIQLKSTQPLDLVDLFKKHAEKGTAFTRKYRARVFCGCGFEGESLLIPEPDGKLGSYQYSCNSCGSIDYLPYFGVLYEEGLIEGNILEVK